MERASSMIESMSPSRGWAFLYSQFQCLAVVSVEEQIKLLLLLLLSSSSLLLLILLSFLFVHHSHVLLFRLLLLLFLSMLSFPQARSRWVQIPPKKGPLAIKKNNWPKVGVCDYLANQYSLFNYLHLKERKFKKKKNLKRKKMKEKQKEQKRSESESNGYWIRR